MTDGNIFELNTPAPDALGQVLKQGAQRLLAQAIEAEVAALLAQHEDKQVDGKQAVVRNGYLPERPVQTGSGDVPVSAQGTGPLW